MVSLMTLSMHHIYLDVVRCRSRVGICLHACSRISTHCTPTHIVPTINSMKSMLMHSFVLDALDTTGADTFSHFEMLIDEHRAMSSQQQRLLDTNFAAGSDDGIVGSGHPTLIPTPSRLRRLVPSIGNFHTRLPLRKAFEAYNAKYGVTKRRYICISFNEIRHILNLAQIIAMIQPQGEGTAEASLLLGEMRIDDKEKGTLATEVEVLNYSQQMDDENVSNNESHENSNSPDEGQNEQQHPLSFVPPLQHPRSRRPLDYHQRTESDAIEETLNLLPILHKPLPGPKLICFDGDQTLYSDGANFEKSPKLAKYISMLLQHGVTIAVVTAAGYEYQAAKYELRLSGLIAYFKERNLEKSDLERFYIFGGECNYLLRLGQDYHLHAVREDGPGGWMISTKYLVESPGNWCESEITKILDKSEACFRSSLIDQNMRATIIRKKRSVGLIPKVDEKIPREALDETVLRIQAELEESKVTLPFCAFNGGRDAWVDIGNKRVGVQVLQSYLGIPAVETLHIGDQFLYTGNDFAARSVCPCVWITSPEEPTYILKSILRLAGVPLIASMNLMVGEENDGMGQQEQQRNQGRVHGERIGKKKVDFEDVGRRTSMVQMDVYTGEFIGNAMPK
jgi:IMP and pyridine-specific 5'-nucleotidase